MLAISLVSQGLTSAPEAPGVPRTLPGRYRPRKAEWLPGDVAPGYLDGSLPGDRGFDPYSLVALAPTGTGDGTWANVERKTQMLMMSPYERKRKLMWMREAEIKHSRLAMMAAAGWPMSELLDRPLSQLLGLPYALEATGGRAPSLLNGHLFDGPQGAFLVLVALATAALELKTLDNVEGLTPSDYVAGDLGFDPLQLRAKRDDMPLAEARAASARRAATLCSSRTPRPRPTAAPRAADQARAARDARGGGLRRAGVHLRRARRRADAAVLQADLALLTRLPGEAEAWRAEGERCSAGSRVSCVVCEDR